MHCVSRWDVDSRADAYAVNICRLRAQGAEPQAGAARIARLIYVPAPSLAVELPHAAGRGQLLPPASVPSAEHIFRRGRCRVGASPRLARQRRAGTLAALLPGSHQQSVRAHAITAPDLDREPSMARVTVGAGGPRAHAPAAARAARRSIRCCSGTIMVSSMTSTVPSAAMMFHFSRSRHVFWGHDRQPPLAVYREPRTQPARRHDRTQPRSHGVTGRDIIGRPQAMIALARR